MTPAARIMRRILFLPIAPAEDRERRLAEAYAANESASRALSNACARLAKRGAEIHALTAGVLERNEEAKESAE